MIASVIALIEAGVSNAEIAEHTGASAHEVEVLRQRMERRDGEPAALTMRQQLLVALAPVVASGGGIAAMLPATWAASAKRDHLVYLADGGATAEAMLKDIDRLIELERETAR